MRYYSGITSYEMSHNEAFKHGRFITRKEWDGFHFINKNGKNTILLSSGELIVTDEIWNEDDEDWVCVSITSDAMDILKKHNMI